MWRRWVNFWIWRKISILEYYYCYYFTRWIFLEILNFSKRFPWSVDSNFYLKYKFRILESQIILKIQLTSEILACHRIRCAFVRALGVDGRTRCTPYCSVWLTNDVRFRISIRLFSANFDEYSRGNFRNSNKLYSTRIRSKIVKILALLQIQDCKFTDHRRIDL